MAIGVQGCRRGMVTADDTVLVLGAGPIGLAIVEVARARGAKVYATDISAERLATAADLGATPIAGGDGLLERVLELTNGEGMPVVMEATGAAAGHGADDRSRRRRRPHRHPRPRQEGQGVTFPGLDFTRKEVTILGSRASVDCFPGGARPARLAARSTTRRSPARFALGEAPAVFAKLADNPMALHKAVFVPEARMKLVTFSHRDGGTITMPACSTAIRSPA